MVIVDLEKKWLSRARCRGKGTDLFYADHGARLPRGRGSVGSKVRAQWEEAQDFCLDCPVMIQCGRDFLGEPEGVFGGMDPIERHTLVFEHSQRVVQMKDTPERREYVALAVRLMNTPRITIQDVQRIMGLRQSTVVHLTDLHEKAQAAAKMAAKNAREAISGPPVRRYTGGSIRTHGTSINSKRVEAGRP